MPEQLYAATDMSSAYVCFALSGPIYAQIDLDQPKAYSYAKEIMTMNALAADGQEGMSAFLEKRPACWTNR